jgi:hypothetical protein
VTLLQIIVKFFKIIFFSLVSLGHLFPFKGRYKTGGTGQLYDGFPDCEWKMNTP